MIFLEAAVIMRGPAGKLFANGGGGGEGGAANGIGQPGKVSLAPDNGANGGGLMMGKDGGNGGGGSVADILSGADSPGQSNNDGGGGGGGGGAGIIRAPGISGFANIAPPPTEPSASQ
jgi:hypothetical protein